MKEWGIFDDECQDYSSKEAIEAGFWSKEEAESALTEFSADDDCYVHKIEEPEEDDDDEDYSEY